MINPAAGHSLGDHQVINIADFLPMEDAAEPQFRLDSLEAEWCLHQEEGELAVIPY